MPPPTLGRPRLQARRPTAPERAATRDVQRAIAGSALAVADLDPEAARKMAITRRTQNLEKLRKTLQDLDGKWDVEVSGLSGLSWAKIGRLEETGRPVLEFTPAAKQQIARFIKAEFERGKTFSVALFQEVGGKAFKKLVLLRFTGQGNDVKWDPLTPEYAAWKRAHGKDRRIGFREGHLFRGLQRATFTLVKK